MTFQSKFSSKLPNKFVTKIMTNFIGYYDGELKHFTLNSKQLTYGKADNSFSPKIIILSSDFYQEQALLYPIGNKKELVKFLKIQRKENEFTLIQSIVNNQSKVNIWTYRKKFPKSWLVIPETFLYGENLNDGEVLELDNQSGTSLYTAQVGGGIYSANSSKFIRTVVLFSISIGLSVQDHIVISSKKKALLIANCLANLKLNKLASFIKSPSQSTMKLAVKKLLTPMAVGLVLYFTMTSAYLSIKTTLLESKIVSQTEQMNQLLDLKASYDEKLNNYHVLSNFWQTRPSVIGLWEVLAPVFSEAKVKSLVLQGNKFVLIGQTKHASALLESIIKNPKVKQAKFQTPVRKDRGMERFNLSFTLYKGLTLSTSKEGKNEGA